MARLIGFASLVSVLAAGCGEDPDPTAAPDADSRLADAGAPDTTAAVAPDADPTTPPACATWRVDLDQQHSEAATRSATIAKGALVLTAEGDTDVACVSDEAPCAPIKVYQGLLQGDFDVSVSLDALQGEAGAHVELFVTSEHAFYYSIGAGMRVGSDGAPLLDVRRLSHPNVASDVKTTASPQAILRLRRVDDLVTATARHGDDVAELGSISLSGDLIVGLRVDQPVSPTRVTAHVSHFHVEGGGGAVGSEDFSCPATLAP